MYVVSYGDARSSPFRIGADVYQRHVWQPTVDSFLPIQMCHVRVNERYRVWHDACHLDDARMAPVNHNHFDGYLQGPSTLTRFAPGQPVPGLMALGPLARGNYWELTAVPELRNHCAHAGRMLAAQVSSSAAAQGRA